MKELVLNTVIDAHNEELTQALISQGIKIVKRNKKQPETRELFFFCSPESYLSLSDNTDFESLTVQLKEWKYRVEQQMDYILSNPDRCFLVDYDYARNQQDLFEDFLKKSLDTETLALQIPMPDKGDLVEKCLLLLDEDTTQDAYEDIIAAADFIDKAEDYSVHSRLHMLIVAMNNDNSELRSKNEKLGTTRDQLQKECVNLQEELASSVYSHTELSCNIKKLQDEKEQLEAEREGLLANSTRLQEESVKLESDNERLLSEVTKLQEQLKASYSNNEKLSDTNKVLESEGAELIAAFDGLRKEYTHLKENYAELNDNCAAAEGDKELALLQITQLQEELEDSYSSNEKLRGTNKALESEGAELKAALDGLKKEHTHLKEAYSKLNNNCAMLEGDKELALLQIAQLQEEVEDSYSKIEKLSSDNIVTQSGEAVLKTALDRAINDNAELKENYTTLVNDYELASLQIIQLQEELECYFIKYQEAGVTPFGDLHLSFHFTDITSSLKLIKFMNSEHG